MGRKSPSPFNSYQLGIDIDDYKEIKPAHQNIMGDMVGYMPTHVSANIPAQNATLTLFLDPLKETTMPDLKFRIDADEKYSIKEELYSIGVERKTLFPGLNGLGESIRVQKYEMIDYERSFTKKMDQI